MIDNYDGKVYVAVRIQSIGYKVFEGILASEDNQPFEISKGRRMVKELTANVDKLTELCLRPHIIDEGEDVGFSDPQRENDYEYCNFIVSKELIRMSIVSFKLVKETDII